MEADDRDVHVKAGAVEVDGLWFVVVQISRGAQKQWMMSARPFTTQELADTRVREIGRAIHAFAADAQDGSTIETIRDSLGILM